MTTRYVTDGEKEGVKRRMAAHRQRLRELGQKPREVWATDAEAERLRAILAVWRGDPVELAVQAREAAESLKPSNPG